MIFFQKKSNAGKGKKLSGVKRANIGTNKRLKERHTQIRSSQESRTHKPGGFSKNEKPKNGKPKKAMFAFAAAQKAGYFTNKR